MSDYGPGYLLGCDVHDVAPPVHGPARLAWVIRHARLGCFPAAGITDADTPKQAWYKAIGYWAAVDRALNDWKAAGALDRFWADREQGGKSWQN